MRKFQILVRVAVMLLLLGCSASLLPLSMAQSKSNSQPPGETSSSVLSTMTTAIGGLWREVVSWLVDDARDDLPQTHVVQTSG